MARTFGKQPLALRLPSNSFLSYAVRELPEGANETFTKDSPVVFSSGLIVEAADPATDILAFAVRAGQDNAVAGAVKSEVVPVIDGLEFYANFLHDTDPSLNNGATGTANALAAADLGGSFDLEKNTILSGSANAWYIGDSAAAASVKIVSFKHDMPSSDGDPIDEAADGDLDARVTAIVLDSVRSWD